MRVILILMNGLRSDGSLTESSELRIKTAAKELREGDSVILSTGYTVNKPPIVDSKGFPILEADVGAIYFSTFAENTPDISIYAETYSRDTIGNIYFSKLLFLDLLCPKEVVIVTSSFHMERVKAVCDLIFRLEEVSYSVGFLAAPNACYAKDVETALFRKEQHSREMVRMLSEKVKSLHEFHKWMCFEHDAYRYDRQPKEISHPLKDAY